MPSSRRFRIVIVGAGIAGSLLSRYLANLPGLDVICLEQATRAGQAQSGTALNIGPNAVTALAALDPPFAATLGAIARPWRRWQVALTDGTALVDLDLGTVADGPGLRVRWSSLYAFLRSAAGTALRLGWTGSVACADGTVRVTARDAAGREEMLGADLVIGCDGRYSAVRAAVFGPPPVCHLGIALSRLLVPNPSGGLIDDYAQWFNGPHRLLAFTVPGDLLYVTTSFPLPGAGAAIPPAARTAAALQERFRPASGSPCPAATVLIETAAAQADRQHWARVQQAPVLFGAGGQPVLLLGDAAHPMAPTLGQGASQAIEDAVGCVRVLRALCVGATPLSAAAVVAAVARQRLVRVRFVQRFSAAASDTLRAGGNPVAGALRTVGPVFQARLQRLYRDVDVFPHVPAVESGPSRSAAGYQMRR
jgi:salicylate hydroxylase